MAGKIKKLLDHIITVRSQGNPTLATVTKTKLILKGLNPDKFGPNTPDDPELLKIVEKLARNTGMDI